MAKWIMASFEALWNTGKLVKLLENIQ